MTERRGENMDKKIVVSLGVDTSGVTSGMAKAQSAVNQGTTGIAGGFKKATSGIGKFIGGIGKIAGAIGVFTLVQFGVNAIQNGVRALTAEMNNNKKAWSSFEGNMKILGKTDKEIQKVKGSLQDYAVQTIYNASDMASTYAQLEAVGTESTESLVKGMAGLAASAENPEQAMKSLSQQMTQAAGRPKIAWEDFKIMLEQAPAGMAAVAEHMGMSMDELVAAIQAGEVSTDDFLAAVTEVGNRDEFQQMATEFRTVDDAIAGLTESLAVKLGPTFDILSEAAISAIGAITEAFENFNWEAFNNGLEKAIEWVTNLFNTIRESTAFQSFGEAIGIIIEDLQEFWVKIQEGDSLLSPLVEDLEYLGQALLDIDFTEIVNDLSRLIEIVGPFIRILGPLVGYIGVAVGVFRLLSSVVTKVTTVFKALKLAFSFVKLITKFKDAITLLGMAFPLLTNPIFWVAAAIAALIAIGVLLWKNWDTIKEKAMELWQVIEPAFQAIWNVISTVFTEIWTFIMDIVNQITSWFQENGELIKNTISTVINFIKNVIMDGLISILIIIGPILLAIVTFFQGAWDNILNIIKIVWDLIKTVVSNAINIVLQVITLIMSVITGDWQGAWEAIKSILQSVWNIIKTVVKSAIGIVKNIILGVLNGIKSIWDSIWQAIGNLLGPIWEGIKSFVSNGIDNIRNKVDSGLSAIQNFFTSKWNAIKSTTSNAISSMVSTVRNKISQFTQAGRDLILGLWNGIKNMFSSVTGWVGDLAQGLVNKVKGIFGVKSPSRVFHQIGEFLMQGFMGGMDSLSGKAMKQMESFSKGIIDEADGIAPGVNSSLNALDPDVSFKGNTSLSAQLDKLKDKDNTPIVHVHVSDGDIILDGEKVGKQLAPTVKKENDKVKGMRDRSKGINSNFGGVFG